MLRSVAVAAALLGSLSPSLAHARQDSDWVLTRAPEQKTVAAILQFSSGIFLMARCTDQVYDLVIGGLPEAPRGKLTRELGIVVADWERPRTTVWTVGENRTVAFSRIPAMVARDLAEGGNLQVIVPPEREGAPRTRYVMELESSGSAVAETLTACGRPLVDSRDAEDDDEGNGQDGLPPALTWATAPRPTFPAPVNGLSPSEGYVVLSCVSDAEGALGDCLTESEQPPGYRLGPAVARAMPRARVKLTEQGEASGHELAGRLIIFSVNFKMEP